MLSSPGVARQFLLSLDQARTDLQFDIFAYVVMPEHCHVLVCPRNEVYDMGKILSAIKSPSAKAILKARPELRPGLEVLRPGRRIECRFWQPGGGYDRNIFKSRTIWDVINYIHMNPVRRGLRELPTQWPWSSAAAYDDKSTAVPVDLCLWGDDLAKPRKGFW
jgi:putative transposase